MIPRPQIQIRSNIEILTQQGSKQLVNDAIID
jgi:hypothetical protein